MLGKVSLHEMDIPECAASAVSTIIAAVYRFKSHSAFPFHERSVNCQSHCSLPPGED